MFNPPFKCTQTCELNTSERLELCSRRDCNGTITYFRECGWKRLYLSFDVPRRIHQHCTKKPRRTRTAPRAHVRPVASTARQEHPGKPRPHWQASDEPATVRDRPRYPSHAARRGEDRLKDFARPNPPGPTTRHQSATEGRGAHTGPPLAGRERATSPHARERAKERFQGYESLASPPSFPSLRRAAPTGPSE